jgi:hypothetical protein
MERTEFGFARTVCACWKCTRFCKFIPGFLVPADLERHRQAQGENFPAWARKHLRASPGALVAQGGTPFRIRTLVPARQEVTGHCIFFKDPHCAIHADAPYGCAFFDEHQSGPEATRRSTAGLKALLAEWIDQGPYALLWQELHAEGLVAPGPEELRRRDRP